MVQVYFLYTLQNIKSLNISISDNIYSPPDYQRGIPHLRQSASPVSAVGGHYLSNTLTDDSVGDCRELLLQLVEQLHDGNVAAARVTARHLLCQAWSSPASSSWKQESTSRLQIVSVALATSQSANPQ
jgi:hypothetical protein